MRRVSASLLEAFRRLRSEDLYFYTLFPCSPEGGKASIANDLSEIYADLSEMVLELGACEETSDGEKALDAWGMIYAQFSVHTMTHLLEVQKVVRWRAGMSRR